MTTDEPARPERAAPAGTASWAAERGRPMRAFSRSLPMALLRTREAVMNRFRPNLRAHNLTDQQWRVIRALVDGGECQVSALAEECCLLMPSLSRILAHLETRGLVRRETLPGDQRRFVISITEAGSALFARVAPASEAEYAAIEALVGAERLDQVYRLLDELQQALDGADGDEEPQKT